ncbi:MAG: helix-turn-helix transcriptional regulator [Bacteroidota bacterium]
MKDRIILLIKAKNLTAAQFADQIGVQKSSISHIISGRNNASLDFIQKILLTYPEVNMDWLLFGKGPIFKGSETIVNANSDKTLSSVSPPVSAPVDLFSEFVPGTSPDFRKENNFIPEQTSDESIPKDTIIEKTVLAEPENKNPVSDIPHQKQETETGNFFHSNHSTKTIVKIVEFYSDNTFREYYPE